MITVKKSIWSLLAIGFIICSCGKDNDCPEDKNGKLNGDCTKVFVDAIDYKSDGETFEQFFIKFRLGTGVSAIFIKDSNSLIEKGTYTEEDEAYYSGGVYYNIDMEINISKVDRKPEGGSVIWGDFHFEGTDEYGRDLELSGFFDEVVLPD
tara:strand:+ start:647 stop:1099 length:453 start_codon:yes stop_codon:yes gene_type:complete